MTGSAFAGSSGVLDVPAPAWIVNDATLFPQWGTFLLALIKHGSIETVRCPEGLVLGDNEFGLLIEGGLFVIDGQNRPDARLMLIEFLKRGDLLTSSPGHTRLLQLYPHSRTTCLVVRDRTFEPFKADFPNWGQLLFQLKAEIAEAYEQARVETMGRDQDRIRRVLTLMAEHPTSVDSKLGRQIEAGKQLIRDLAGVQKRSATRAFRALEEDGEVSFHGYKRLFFKG